MFEKVTSEKVSGKSGGLVAQNPFKDKGTLKDFSDIGELEKQAVVQLGIIKEFIENF